MTKHRHTIIRAFAITAVFALPVFAADAPAFRSLFNGRDLAGWVIPEGDNGHWIGAKGVIDYDAASEAKGDKTLWTEREFKNFKLVIDWRIKETHGLYPMNTILPDGSNAKDKNGKEIITPTPNADSGIYLRGDSKSQVNIWCWPIGSGELWGYRTDPNMPPEIRAAATPKVRADKPVGEWNTFEITVQGDRLGVVLNGKLVIDNMQMLGVPEKGRIGLQHHGGRDKNGQYDAASSLVQFRNIYIKELP
jgi:hypothetical protein